MKLLRTAAVMLPGPLGLRVEGLLCRPALPTHGCYPGRPLLGYVKVGFVAGPSRLASVLSLLTQGCAVSRRPPGRVVPTALPPVVVAQVEPSLRSCRLVALTPSLVRSGGPARL
eukprot:12717931-Heterocapsa_arctica.AAC.1